MGHDHPHGHGPHDAEAGDRKVALAVIVNLGLTVAQLVGGLISGSVALIADAVHNFSDAISLILAYGARRIARRPATPAMSFGYGRAELVATLVNYTTLVVIAIWLATEAVMRLVDPPAVTGWIVVALAGLALVIDLATAALTWRLAKQSLNIRAAFLHNLADAGTSVAVIIGGTLILLYDWRLVDPLITLGISAYILWHAAQEIGPVVRILMLAAPADIGPHAILQGIKAVAGVLDAHHLHFWQIDERRTSVEAHLVVAEGADAPAIVAAVKESLLADFGLRHVTLETETIASGCASSPLPATHGPATP